MCIGCNEASETMCHFFFECPFFSRVWYELAKWLGVDIVIQNSVLDHFWNFSGWVFGGKVLEAKLCTLWFACIWSVWKAWNPQICHNKAWQN